MTTFSRWAFLASGTWAVLCAPAILLAERFSWSQRPFHLTQILAALTCLVSSSLFLWTTRGNGFGWQRSLALVAGTLSGLWVAFFSYVLLTFDLGMD